MRHLGIVDVPRLIDVGNQIGVKQSILVLLQLPTEHAELAYISSFSLAVATFFVEMTMGFQWLVQMLATVS